MASCTLFALILLTCPRFGAFVRLARGAFRPVGPSELQLQIEILHRQLLVGFVDGVMGGE